MAQLAFGRANDAVRLALDPQNVLATVGVRGAVDYTVVNGKITVRQGHLETFDEAALASQANQVCAAYLNH